MSSFLIDPVMGLFPLFRALDFRRNRTYLNLLKARSEVVVERERISAVHVSA